MDLADQTTTRSFLNSETEQIFYIDPAKYDFPALLCELFNCDDLQKLHLRYPEKCKFPPLDRLTNTRTWFHDKFYDQIRAGWPELQETYRRLVQHIGRDFLEEKEIIFQRNPTLRVNVPGNTATGPFHTDAEYNHPATSLNFILPLTPMFESNTVVCESEPGKRDFRHIPLQPGELFHFNGAQCLHGNLVNTTGATRMSFDFRLMRVVDYDPETEAKTWMSNIPLRVGYYYDQIVT